MEEVVCVMQEEIGDLKGEMKSLKEFLQQVLKVQQEVSGIGA